MALLEVKDLTFSYKTGGSPALENINLTVNSGEFVVICGESGCGKSTLLRLLKKQLIPAGDMLGAILYDGVAIQELDERKSVTDIGFVMQSPDNQIVTDKVWHELSFGLESLGEDSDAIRSRVAEISGFFGINDWYRMDTCKLSGGQKQLLNLASIMVMNPKILALDEPTSQLDPIAASEFISTLKKINNELGMTIILVEHRLEEVFPLADKVVVMDKAKILMVDTPRNVGRNLRQIDGHKMNLGMPSAIRIFNGLDIDCVCPLTVREGKDFLKEHFDRVVTALPEVKQDTHEPKVAIEIIDAYFRYEKNANDILRGLNLTVYKDEILCILGGNGSGKTTTLRLISGLNKLYSGKIKIWGKNIKEYNGNTLYRNNISTLPQNPLTLFVASTVRSELYDVTKIMEYSKEQASDMVGKISSKLEIEHLFDRHPYDLSGGESQKVAFAKILLMSPKIILLDEPTKGIDAYSKKVLADMLNELKAEGITIVMVTHDIEFAAEHADRCAMFFDGQIVANSSPKEFFAKNSFYTTSASRISRDMYDKAITSEMVTELCKLNHR